ncbi:MAG: sugar phosphate isomerase/epimerase [Verrucomicrobia bacterium]|nr:sugar phosphate isomerase/epimerase [Verrucomicrobiota bacterium]MBI3868374.1 sugar phosphate isomerase/epimerase [Verrucomicrobiota bacterium]
MKPSLSRRSFCRSTLLGGAFASAFATALPTALPAVEPFPHSPLARLRLGLAAYSFRDFFKEGKRKAGAKLPGDNAIDMFGFIDFCAEHRCEGAELTSYYFPPDADDAYFLKVKRHAFLRGVTISGSAVGNTFTHPPGPKRDQEVASVKKWIDRAALMGAPHIRVFAGGMQAGTTPAEARGHCVSAMEEVGDYAAKKGVFLGIENHGGIVEDAEGLLAIVKAVKNPWVGINLDTGNFHTINPFDDLERCAPYAVNVQYKAEMKSKGESPKPSDMPRVMNLLRKSGYQGFVTLEYESAEDPWQAVPRILDSMRAELARPV